MTKSLTVEKEVHFRRQRYGRKEIESGQELSAALAPRIPRLARLLALAMRLDDLVRRGEVRDYATLARVGRVSRARISQILGLLYLAPGIQEEILFLPRPERGRDPLVLSQVLPLTRILDWRRQRRLWKKLQGTRATISS